MSGFETDRADAWSCGVCDNLYWEKGDADRCCTCKGCHAKFAKDHPVKSECEGCLWKIRVRHARADIRRYKQSVADKEKYLAELLKNRPPKASEAA